MSCPANAFLFQSSACQDLARFCVSVGVQYSTMFDSVKLFPVVVRYVTVDFLYADQIM